jgi:hypothetical protein
MPNRKLEYMSATHHFPCAPACGRQAHRRVIAQHQRLKGTEEPLLVVDESSRMQSQLPCEDETSGRRRGGTGYGVLDLRRWYRRTHQLQSPFADFPSPLPQRSVCDVYTKSVLLDASSCLVLGITNLKVNPTNMLLPILSSLSAISSRAFCLS